jgi:alkylation response protein AidB-like acyl-CoA dehydrogenase
MDFTLTDEQEMLRETVWKLGTDFGHRYYSKKAAAGQPAAELWNAISSAGFVGVAIPEAYDGGGLGMTEMTIVIEELSAAGCPLLNLVVLSVCAPVIERYGTQEQKERWLPGMARGQIRMAFAITEPDAGSNSHRIATKAVPDGQGYRLSGAKYWISGVDESDLMMVVARTGTDESTGRARLSLFVVDTDASGIEQHPIASHVITTERQFSLFFDDVAVGHDRLLGNEGDGLRQIFHGLNPERVTSAAVATGIGRFALAKASAQATQRRVWNVPIGAHQGLAHPLAKAKIHLEHARLATQRAAWLIDNGVDAGEAANMAKYAAAEAALEALDEAIQVHGGSGLSAEVGLADLWGVARLYRIAPVSSEMILNYVAERSLGLPRSY